MKDILEYIVPKNSGVYIQNIFSHIPHLAMSGKYQLVCEIYIHLSVAG